MNNNVLIINNTNNTKKKEKKTHILIINKFLDFFLKKEIDDFIYEKKYTYDESIRNIHKTLEYLNIKYLDDILKKYKFNQNDGNDPISFYDLYSKRDNIFFNNLPNILKSMFTKNNNDFKYTTYIMKLLYYINKLHFASDNEKNKLIYHIKNIIYQYNSNKTYYETEDNPINTPLDTSLDIESQIIDLISNIDVKTNGELIIIDNLDNNSKISEIIKWIEPIYNEAWNEIESYMMNTTNTTNTTNTNNVLVLSSSTSDNVKIDKTKAITTFFKLYTNSIDSYQKKHRLIDQVIEDILEKETFIDYYISEKVYIHDNIEEYCWLTYNRIINNELINLINSNYKIIQFKNKNKNKNKIYNKNVLIINN
jgi:hypothetical protein